MKSTNRSPTGGYQIVAHMKENTSSQNTRHLKIQQAADLTGERYFFTCFPCFRRIRFGTILDNALLISRPPWVSKPFLPRLLGFLPLT